MMSRVVYGIDYVCICTWNYKVYYLNKIQCTKILMGGLTFYIEWNLNTI